MNEEVDLMKSALSWYNYQNAKKKADRESLLECQIWSDATELNRLEYTQAPEIPEYVKPKVEKLSAGIYNLVRQILP